MFGLGRELLFLSYLAPSNKTDCEALGFLAAAFGAETLADGNMFLGIFDYSR